MSGAFTKGTAWRAPVQMHPVKHILVPGNDARDWRMWCSGSKGREDNPMGNRLCRACRDLAREACDEEMLDPSEVGREWFTDDQLARCEAEDGR